MSVRAVEDSARAVERSNRMMLHVVALPHTQTTAAFASCAYTQKVRKFVKMMRTRGYRVVLYGSEISDVEADENVCIVTEKERAGWFGPGFDTVLSPLSWDAAEPYWQTANMRAVSEIAKRCDLRDILCLIAGYAQQPVRQHLQPLTCAEWGVGYLGVLPDSHRAFESSAWMHYVYGHQAAATEGRDGINGRFYDTVIPNFFDRGDFRLGKGDGGYLLYLGRLVERKGVHVAVQIAERLGKKLLIAGPGALVAKPGHIRTPELTLHSPLIEYVGEVGLDQRRDLLAGAEALLTPTLYLEPFGGVAVEAMLSGTPVVASDFGAFRETVEPGVTGYRFSTLAEGAAAVELALRLDRPSIRRHALDRYTLEAVGPMFDRWFTRLDGLWDGGWEAA